MKKINILLNQLSKYKEAFSTWKYRVPKDKEQQLYDFYVLMSLNPKKFTDENLLTAYNEAMVTLVNYLYPELLEAVFFGICCEFRHVFDRNTAREIYGVPIKFKIGIQQKEFRKFLQEYWSAEKDIEDIEIGSDFRYQDSTTTYIKAYETVLKALKTSGMTKEEFVKITEICFDKYKWNGAYGGEKWGMVSRGWLHSVKSEDKDLTSKMLAVDLLYSLQHNTNTILNKLNKYYKSGDAFGWVLKALNRKFSAKDPTYDLWEYTSHNLKSFAAASYKNITGKSIYADVEKHNKYEVSGYALIHPNDLPPNFISTATHSNTLRFPEIPTDSVYRHYGKNGFDEVGWYLNNDNVVHISLTDFIEFLKKRQEEDEMSLDDVRIFFSLKDSKDNQVKVPAYTVHKNMFDTDSVKNAYMVFVPKKSYYEYMGKDTTNDTSTGDKYFEGVLYTHYKNTQKFEFVSDGDTEPAWTLKDVLDEMNYQQITIEEAEKIMSLNDGEYNPIKILSKNYIKEIVKQFNAVKFFKILLYDHLKLKDVSLFTSKKTYQKIKKDDKTFPGHVYVYTIENDDSKDTPFSIRYTMMHYDSMDTALSKHHKKAGISENEIIPFLNMFKDKGIIYVMTELRPPLVSTSLSWGVSNLKEIHKTIGKNNYYFVPKHQYEKFKALSGNSENQKENYYTYKMSFHPEGSGGVYRLVYITQNQARTHYEAFNSMGVIVDDYKSSHIDLVFSPSPIPNTSTFIAYVVMPQHATTGEKTIDIRNKNEFKDVFTAEDCKFYILS